MGNSKAFTMSLYLHHLDPRTRLLMHNEVQHDLARGALYLSRRLTDPGRAMYVPTLLNAVMRGDTDSFAQGIQRNRLLKTHEESHSRRGMPFVKAVPHDAHVTLAEGEFHRFYLRGLSARAVEDGIEHLEIFRAKVVHVPRWESEARIGKRIAPSALLADLREHPGVDLALGVPNGPNSGLSARLPANANI
jgi:hypothetical protein